MSTCVVTFVEGDEANNREYGAVSLYLPVVQCYRQPAGVRTVLDSFFDYQSRGSHREPHRFDSAGGLSAAFVRWYWGYEGADVEIVPYNGEWDVLVRCEWNDERPVVTERG